MDKVDVVVIGAGVIGLAVARTLARAGRDVVVVERHDGFGRETSSRNSEVIHCGMYYAEDLLKTRLCARQRIPHRITGKIVVATEGDEEASLHAILGQGKTNGVPGLRLIGRGEIEKLEPLVSATLGLHSPGSGIVDSHALMAFLEQDARSAGAVHAYGCDVVGMKRRASGYAVEVLESGGERSVLESDGVVNAAGLSADRVAALAGIDCESAGYTIRPCKGEYFKVSARHRGTLSHLVYPVPSPYHLGAHAVLGLDSSLRIGPSSFYVDTLDYAVDPAHQAEFHEKARRFLPFLERDDLSPDLSGIRPKLYRRGESFRDFVIREESDRGLPGFVDLVGMESPGLTSCLAIAEMVGGLL